MSNAGDTATIKEQQAARTRQVMSTHEKDERWTAVDKYALKHLHTADSPYYSAIEKALQLSEEKGLPSIEVSLLQGKWLQTQCQMIDAEHILEVGTLGGVSSILMAASGPNAKVTTVEVDPERVAVAEEAIANAGLSDRVQVMTGAGIDVLPRLRQQVESGSRPKYDFIFIDADKPNNLNYFNESIRMARSRACIIVDNVVRMGRLADDTLVETDVGVSGARQVIQAAAKDNRVLSSTLLQTVGEKNYDGMFIAIVK